MRNRSVALIFGLLLLPVWSRAQVDGKRHVVLPLADGGFVAFKSETAWAGATKASAPVQQLPGEFGSQAFIDEEQVIHRVLLNATGSYVFGYDLLIQAVPASKTFTVAVKPLDLEVEKGLLLSRPSGQPKHIATLPQSAEPQILDDGDSFALDLLVNQNTGVKIVDLVRVSFDRANLWDDNPRTMPKDFTLDAVALTLSDFRLLIDGNVVAAGKPGTNFSGALLWCYVEGKGRFIFSLVPRADYPFQKVGTIDQDKIEFTVRGKHYEWLSRVPILPGGGTWNVWVLHDPTYLPFGFGESARKEKSKLDRLDDSIKAAKEKATRIGDPAAATFHPQTEDATPESPPKRFRVMVGAADRIENLWPRND
jgi:hypothetical protein